MAKNLKKFTSVVMGAVMVFALAAAGCGGTTEGEEHVHSWSTEWSKDAQNHWHDCDGCDETKDLAPHSFSEGECTVCGQADPDYEPPITHTHSWSTVWSKDETNHWHACSGCTEIKDSAPHTFSEGVCTVCGQVDPDYDPDQGGEEFVSTPLPAGNKIYVVGDSTVSSFDDYYYLPRYGYGTQIAEYFNVTSDQVVNLALSGRSSLSFLSESNYTTLKTSISEGDYLIIGFGHNDEKSDDAARFTDATKSYTDDSTAGGPSFAYTLYQNYVKLAKDAGATPILCTPIVRYSSTGDYTGAKIHDTETGNYSQAIKTLGEATDTTVIDLTTITKTLYEQDNAAAAYFHAHTSFEGTKPNETPAGRDDTHINKYGAQMVVYQLATALSQTNNSLAAHIKENISAPTDWTIAINSKYVKSDYTAPNLDNLTPLATIAGTNTATGGAYETVWYKSTLGDIGGNGKLANFSSTYTDGTFTVSNAGGTNGKFASTTDGFTAAFMQVSANDNFTISVDAKLVSLGGSAGNNQTGFGLMLRDDMYIDVDSKMIQSNYVAAGIIADGTTIFSRSSKSALTKGSKSITPTAGATYNLTIKRLGQVVTVTVKDGANTYTQTYTDFDFTAVDNNYMYICLFANRNLTIEYSNVTFSYDGVSQGA